MKVDIESVVASLKIEYTNTTPVMAWSFGRGMMYILQTYNMVSLDDIIKLRDENKKLREKYMEIRILNR